MDEEPTWPDAGVSAGLDWLRFTGREACTNALIQFADTRFGSERKETTGAFMYRIGLEWYPGVQVSWGHNKGSCMIDIRGERLSSLSGDERISLMRAIADLGLKATRIDLALDYIDQDRDIYENALESCNAGQLCLRRRFSPDPEYTADGWPLRKLLKLGKRDSAVCVRIYDKGLERGLGACGRWERIEAEFKGDRAPQVPQALLDAGDNWEKVAADLILGAVDFREKGDRSELDRRERVSWWAGLIEGLTPQKVRPLARVSDLNAWALSFRQSYGRRIVQMAHAVGVDTSIVAEWLLSGVEPSRDASPVVAEFRSVWSGGEV